MPNLLQDGTLLTQADLAKAARQARRDEGDSQEDAAAKLNVGQAQVSKAENGSKKYRSLCIRLITLYTEFEVEHPLYKLKTKM